MRRPLAPYVLLALAGLLLAPIGCSLGPAVKPVPPIAVASVPAMERGGPPVYSLGDRWILSTGIYELIRVEDDRYVFSAGALTEIHLTKDLVLVKNSLGGSNVLALEFSPPPRLDWPLAVGKHGTWTGSFKPLYSAEAYLAELTWVVEAYEEVEVPAGKFKAFRVAFKIEPRVSTNFGGPPWWRGVPQKLSYQLWYAPEVRRFVKSASPESWQLRFEVIAVDPEETAPLKVDLREPEDQSRFGVTARPPWQGRSRVGRELPRLPSA